MRERDTEASPGARYMSPLVKQDLARLDKDGESRRSAMNSLKQFVENLDPGSMPRFLAQVSETRDQGVSRSYAISLYEEVARVHGKLIIPHIPRVMATVTRSLSSSGSSPQLHQACAKVVSAVARYSVDGGSPVQADEILRELCDPLLGVLAGKLEPLAAGAAVCLQALVECEKWKYASDQVVNEACLRTTVALGEKITRTVAHMQLARSLAATNPSFFHSYGVALLRTGSEVLRQTLASGTWQQRACAARLLQAVLPTVDRATLASELEDTIQALDACKHDRMAHVRTAVSEALKTAKVLSSHESRVAIDGKDPLPGTPCLSSLEVDESRPKESFTDMRSSFGGSEDVFTFSSKQGSSPADLSEESILSFFPYASPDSSISALGSPSIGKHRRSPLPPTSPICRECSHQTSALLWVDGLDAHLNPGRSCEVQAKENVPSRNLDVNAGVACDPGPSCRGSPCSSQVRKHVRTRPPAPGFSNPRPPLPGDKMGTGQQSGQTESSTFVMSNGRQGGKSYSALENSVLTIHRKQEGAGILAEEEEVSSNGTTVDIEVETSMNSNTGLPSKQSRYNQVQTSKDSSSSSRFSPIETILNSQTRMNLFDVDGSAGHRTDQSVAAQSLDECLRDSSGSHDLKESFDSLCNQHQRHSPLPRLGLLEDVSSPQITVQKPRALLTADDFLPFSTPRRLVRSLQSDLSSPAGSGIANDHDIKMGDEAADMPDMDLETCSEEAWSVRDNPIASDDSLKTGSGEEDKEQRGNVYNKVTIDSSSRNCPANLDTKNLLTNDCERLSFALLHAAESLFCTSTGRALELGCHSVNEEIVNGKLDNNVNDFGIAPASSQRDLHTLVGENGLSDCFCCGQVSNSKQSFEGGEYQLKKGGRKTDTFLTHDLHRDKAVGVLRIRFHRSFRDKFGEGLRSVQAYTEMFLGGFLLIVLALPFAMVMSKIMCSHLDHPGLIPT